MKSKNIGLFLLVIVSIILGIVIGVMFKSNTIQNTIQIGTMDKKININTASEDELESLGGIGEVKANRIIEKRPFNSIYDIKQIIGDTTFNKIKDELEVN